MAIQQIEYEDKVALNVDIGVPDKNKCKADDMNEIKSVVNNNSYETPKVSSQVDTDYKVNVITTKNLFDINNANILNKVYIDENQQKLLSSNDAVKTLYIQCNANTTYTISKIASARFRVGTTTILPEADLSISNYSRNDSGTSITITTSSTAKYLCVFYYNGAVDTLTEQQILNSMQIEIGETATTYEPFIQSTINVNNEKYTETLGIGTEINIKNRMNVLCSKNLLNINASVNASFTVNSTAETLSPNGSAITSAWIPCKPNTTYTLGGQKNRNRWQTKASDGTITYMGESGSTITTNATAKYIRVYYWYQDGSAVAPNSKNTMLVEGNTAPADYIPYITPSINIDGNEIYSKAISEYTTSEQVIGRWIDGKPLYRKVVDFGTLPNATSKTISTGLTASTTRITKIDGVARDNSSGYCIAIPHINTNNIGGGIQVEFNTSGEIFIRTSANYSSLNGYMILEYTKTTD